MLLTVQRLFWLIQLSLLVAVISTYGQLTGVAYNAAAMNITNLSTTELTMTTTDDSTTITTPVPTTESTITTPIPTAESTITTDIITTMASTTNPITTTATINTTTGTTATINTTTATTAATTATASTINTTTATTATTTATINTTTATTTTAITTTTTTATTTTTTTTATTTTTTTTPEICGSTRANAINITYRTSVMFTGLITYNCSFINSSELSIYNDTSDSCFVTEPSDLIGNNTVNVTCNNIENNAGRNWTFILGGNSTSQIIIDEIFIITLEPLLLNTTYINITKAENFTAIVVVPDCEKITDLKYLVFRCNSSDTSNNTLSSDCTFTCSDQEPGSINDASLVRLPIPIADKIDNNNNTFPEVSLNETYNIGLDKIRDLSFDSNLTLNGTASIYFKRPGGNYDKISIECYAQDQNCSTQDHTLSNNVGNCSSCTFVSISPVLRGMNYTCQASTIKDSFDNVTSDKRNFATNLTSVTYDGLNSSNTSQLIFNVTAHSDFEHIIVNCSVVYGKLPCLNLTVRNNQCSKTLKLNGALGCGYSCLFTTKKTNYDDQISNILDFTVYPPKPNITRIVNGSRWISINWIINDIAYIESFDIFQDNDLIGNLNNSDFSFNATNFSYNYTNLEPFRDYKLHVKLNSNDNVLSETIDVKTLEAAPKKPNGTDVENSITPQSTTEPTQQVIVINPSLFSNDRGIVHTYLIYVRQDLKNNQSDTILNGTYYQAIYNHSLDYLAIQIPRIPSRKRVSNNVSNINVLLGNETSCTNESVPCNGPLKPSTDYKLVVAGCTNGGCTNVLSKEFRTQNTHKPSDRSLIWVVVFPALALVVIVALLARWKRRPLKRLIKEKLRNNTSNRPSLRSSSYNIIPKRPKPLYKFVNMTNEDDREIYAEYQELDNTAPQYRQSDYEAEYGSYDRYRNISARGPWDTTAVRLTGDHRVHDYINANEIKGLNSDKQYIACQGPLEDTSEDFWEMIIEYQVSKIVMLTRLEERNPHNPSQTLSKCFRYFPETKGQSLTFNRIIIQTVEIENRPDVTLQIRHLVVKDDRKEHHVFHYYFTGWPDFSVIDREKLLDLIETIDNHGRNSSSKTKDPLTIPMVVHCSAGVGRTGTYIAVDIIRRLISQSQKILLKMELDVMGIVYQLKQDRVKMVQTKDQYMLVNRSVEECLKRINRLDDILKQSLEDENNQSQTTYIDHHVNFTKPDEDSGLEASCTLKKVRKDSSLGASGRHNSSGVVYRQSQYENSIEMSTRTSVNSQLH